MFMENSFTAASMGENIGMSMNYTPVCKTVEENFNY